MEAGELREVEIAVSPGHTWITAPSSAVAWFVRETVGAAGLTYGTARQGGRLVDVIVDLGEGKAAVAACQALRAMGVRFRWHMDQDPARGEDWHRELLGDVGAAEAAGRPDEGAPQSR